MQRFRSQRCQLPFAFLAAALLGLAGAQLSASCQNDECTTTVLWTSSSGDWCKEYITNASGLWLRAATADGNNWRQLGNTYQAGREACSGCDCSPGSVRRCSSASGWQGGSVQVTWWECYYGSSSG